MGYRIQIEQLDGQPSRLEISGVDQSVGGYRFEQQQIDRLCKTITTMIVIYGMGDVMERAEKIVKNLIGNMKQEPNGETDSTAAE